MTRRKVSLTVGLVFALVTSAVGATVWIHTKLDDKISTSEFERFMQMNSNSHREILDRLRSIEEAMRDD